MSTPNCLLAVSVLAAVAVSHSAPASDLLDAPGPGYRQDHSETLEPIQHVSRVELRVQSPVSTDTLKSETPSQRFKFSLNPETITLEAPKKVPAK